MRDALCKYTVAFVQLKMMIFTKEISPLLLHCRQSGVRVIKSDVIAAVTAVKKSCIQADDMHVEFRS